MTNNYDLGIIGSGVAGAFAAYRVADHYKNSKTILFDLGKRPGKRRHQIVGFLGCFPAGDGKIYTDDVDKISEITDGRKVRHASKWVMDLLKEVNPMKIVKDVLPSIAVQKKIAEANFDIKLNNYIQWKPDNIHHLSKIIADKLENSNNIQFSFDTEVYTIIKKRNMFLVSTSEGDFNCKKIILCVGRSGWRWCNNLYKEFGINSNDDFAKFGIRIEISASHLKDFKHSHCSLIREDLELGPFSWNGTVIPEDHSDLVISAFRSNEDRWKSDKVSFSLLHKEYFQNKGVHQSDRLAKLAFLLFNDRVSRERIRTIIKNNSQLSLLPEYSWLKDSLSELEKIIPNLCAKGYFHVPNICPMVPQINLDTNLESEVEGMFVAGESAGISGILAAAVMGTLCIDSAFKG